MANGKTNLRGGGLIDTKRRIRRVISPLLDFLPNRMHGKAVHEGNKSNFTGRRA